MVNPASNSAMFPPIKNKPIFKSVLKLKLVNHSFEKYQAKGPEIKIEMTNKPTNSFPSN